MPREYLNNKFVLFDTNFLIAIKNHPPEKFEDFFKMLVEHKCTSCINEFIKNEFLFGAMSKKILEDQRRLLKKYFTEFSLTHDKKEKITDDAFELHRMYCTEGKSTNKNQISFVDCINGAFLLNRPNESLIITTDLNDFPLKIFDRLEVFAIDLEKEVITLGIYKFNEERYKAKKSAIRSIG